jgi:hypothetical protein
MLVGLAICYGAWLWWIHELVRSPLNDAYFTQYVVARCTAAATDRLGTPPRSKERVEALGHAMAQCQAVEVAVDGAWGGILGSPSVRLRVVADGGARTEMRYYSVTVDPVLGIASIAYELDPALYYWTL